MSARASGGSLCSMTGFASVEGTIDQANMRLEIKSLNHRYLDIKVRLPREFSALENRFRKAIQESFSRGSFDIKVERVIDAGDTEADFQTNVSLAAHYYECLITLQKTLGLADSVKTSDILQFPDVITKNKSASDALTPDKLWEDFSTLLDSGMKNLREMRTQEGKKIGESLSKTADSLITQTAEIRKIRSNLRKEIQERIEAKVKKVFEAYPINEHDIAPVLESRIAQELAFAVDKTDIEEELTRLDGHLKHFCEILSEKSGPAGRRLEFVLQEANREISTLGNKAQDLSISGLVVELKVQLEQLREQVLNLE